MGALTKKEFFSFAVFGVVVCKSAKGFKRALLLTSDNRVGGGGGGEVACRGHIVTPFFSNSSSRVPTRELQVQSGESRV